MKSLQGSSKNLKRASSDASSLMELSRSFQKYRFLPKSKKKLNPKSLQGPEKDCINIEESQKKSICSQDSCKEYFVLQGSLKEFMEFEESSEQSLECKDPEISLQGLYNSQCRVGMQKLSFANSLG